MFNVFVLSFKTFISSVYSVTGIAMPLSILGISWSFISSIYIMCVCVCVCVYVYIYIYNKYRFRHRLGTGTVLKVSIWHRYQKKKNDTQPYSRADHACCAPKVSSRAGVFNLWGAPPQGGASTCQGGREHQLIQRHCLEDL